MTHVGMFEEAWLNDENKALKKISSEEIDRIYDLLESESPV